MHIRNYGDFKRLGNKYIYWYFYFHPILSIIRYYRNSSDVSFIIWVLIFHLKLLLIFHIQTRTSDFILYKTAINPILDPSKSIITSNIHPHYHMVLSPGSLHHRSGSCASASPASSGWNLACPAGSSALPGPRCKPYTLGHGTLPRCNSLPAYLLIGCKNIRGPLARIPPQLSTVFQKRKTMTCRGFL